MAGCLIIVANFWLAGALVLVIGSHLARTQPTMYSFLPIGDWVYPETYNLWIGLCLAAAVIHFGLAYAAWWRKA